MHIAAIKGENKIIKILLLFNANPFIFTYSNNYSPLDYARESKKIEVIKILQPIFDARKENAHKIHVAALQSFQSFYQNYSELSDECDFLNALQDHDYYLRTIASTAFLAMIVSNPKLIEDFNEDGCFFEFSPIIPRWVKEIVKIVIFQEDGSLQFIYWPYHLYTSSTSACLQL